MPYTDIAKKLNRSTDGIRNHIFELNKRLPDVEFAPMVVGVFDIETLPMEAYVWGLFDQNIGIEQIITRTCLLSWAGKFLNGAKVYSDLLTETEAPMKNDERIVRSCYEFLKQCNVVIGQNIQQFDTKLMNTFFLMYGLPPIKYIQVDTWLIAKQNFRFDSNKMGWMSKVLNIRQKVEHEGFPLWKKCHEGNKDALARMLEYNIGDIHVSEELYFKVRPFVKSFNVALFNEMTTNQCPTCGSPDVKEEGFWYTPAGKWLSYRCQKCGCLSRSKYNEIDKDKRKSLLVNS